MNIANKLTVLRVVLIPFFIAFGLMESTLFAYIALMIFVVASFTDYLDGHLARKLGLVSDFGKFLDPLADKLLVFAALALLVHKGDISVWVFYIVVLREMVVTGIRLIAASSGRVIAAGFTGKLKTMYQMVLITAALIPWINDNLFSIGTPIGSVLDILMYIMVAITLVSGAEYVIKNADVIKP